MGTRGQRHKATGGQVDREIIAVGDTLLYSWNNIPPCAPEGRDVCGNVGN